VVYSNQSPAARTEREFSRTAEGDRASFSALQRAALIALAAYKRFVSPLLPSACRFYPTCSEYMFEAVERYGTGRGVWMGIKRLVRCHPFHPGGLDPVP
jgi:uncharacterized protein